MKLVLIAHHGSPHWELERSGSKSDLSDHCQKHLRRWLLNTGRKEQFCPSKLSWAVDPLPKGLIKPAERDLTLTVIIFWQYSVWNQKINADTILCCAVLSHFSSVQLFCDVMDYSRPGSSVHGILQARTLEWVAMPSSRGSSQPRDRTCISCGFCTGRLVLYH